MIIPLGQMRDPVVILTPVRGTDESGGEDITYTAGDPIFLALRSITTREGIQFGQMNSDVSHIAFGHWFDLNTLTSEHRVRSLEDETVEYDIDGGPVNDASRGFTRLKLVRRENA